MRRMQHRAMRHAGQHDVIDVAPLAGQKPRILDPPHRLPDPELGHVRRPFLLSDGTIWRRTRKGNRRDKAEAPLHTSVVTPKAAKRLSGSHKHEMRSSVPTERLGGYGSGSRHS